MSILSSYLSLAALRTGMLAIPGANYALLAYDFITRYWKPIAIAIALGYSFHLGVAYEAKKNDTAQIEARLKKATFERDNLVKAANNANILLEGLDNQDELNRRFLDALKSKPVVGDCTLSRDAVKRLSNGSGKH